MHPYNTSELYKPQAHDVFTQSSLRGSSQVQMQTNPAPIPEQRISADAQKRNGLPKLSLE